MNNKKERERERKVSEASFSRVTPSLTTGRGEFEKILVLLASASALIASGEKAVAAALWVCDSCRKEEFNDRIGLKDAMLYIQFIGDDAGITSKYSTVSPGGLVMDS